MISGQQALGMINGSLRNEHASMDTVETRIAELSAELLALQQARVEEFRELARLRVDMIASGNMLSSIGEQEKDEKGQSYRDDPLFMYLWQRGYGTSQYRAWPVTRWLDSKVARLIRFEDARANYARLQEIPPEVARARRTEKARRRSGLCRIACAR